MVTVEMVAKMAGVCVEPLTAFSTIGERSRAKLPREFDRSCASWIFSRTHWAELFQ